MVNLCLEVQFMKIQKDLKKKFKFPGGGEHTQN